MYVRLDDDVDAANAVEGYHFVFVFAPVAHLGHVFSVGCVLLVAFCENDVFGEGGGQFEGFGGFLPRVVVETAFYVLLFAVDFFVAVEPYVWFVLVFSVLPPIQGLATYLGPEYRHHAPQSPQ